MIRALRLLLTLLAVGAIMSGCFESDPHAKKRAEDERLYLESRLETMEAELRESLVNLPAERILELIGPEVMARQARVASAEMRGIVMSDLRAELTVELDLRCEEQCVAGLLNARRADRAEAEAGRDRSIEEIKKLREDLDGRKASLDKAREELEAERAKVVVVEKAAAPITCSPEGDAAFQVGLYGDALGKYRAALHADGPPECHRVLAAIYGALGYKKNQVKHLTDYLHVMRSELEPQQEAIIHAELRAAKR